MPTPVELLAPAGITWEMAMTKAGEILADLPHKTPKFGLPEFWSSRSAQAQAWIAFAREITMHTRATK